MYKKIMTIIMALFLVNCASGPGKPIVPDRPSSAAIDRDSLQIGFSDGDDALSVRKSITLPLLGEEGSIIQWSSSDPLVVTTEGMVNPSVNRDRKVQLIALISSEGDERRKIFDLLVLRNETKVTYPQITHTIDIDGDLKDWKSGEKIPSSTQDLNYYITWDGSNLYLGVEGRVLDIHGPKARDTWVVAYLGFPEGDPLASEQGEFFRTQNFKLPFNASYLVKWRVSDSYIQSGLPKLDKARNRVLWGFGLSPTSPDFNPLGLSNQSVANAIGTMEMSIPLEKIGRPLNLLMTVFIVQETEGEETSFGIIPFTSAQDGPAPNGLKVFSSYLTLDLTSKLGVSDQFKASMGKSAPAQRSAK